MSSNRLSVVEDIEELNHWAAKSINNIRLKGKLQMNIKRGDKHERINLEYRQRKALGNQIWKDTIKKNIQQAMSSEKCSQVISVLSI